MKIEYTKKRYKKEERLNINVKPENQAEYQFCKIIYENLVLNGGYDLENKTFDFGIWNPIN